MGVEFEDQYKNFTMKNGPEKKQMFLVRFLLKYRFAKTEQGANNAVIIFFLIIAISSIVFAVWYVKKASVQKEVKYQISSEVLKLLPEEIQSKILEQ